MNTKSLIDTPPKKYMITSTSSVEPKLSTFRLRVWLTLRLISDQKSGAAARLTFSRIRSKITIVLFSEYPMTIRIEATTGSEICRPSSR